MSGRLSPAQRKVLQNIAAGRAADFGFKPGRSTAGGLSGTFVALFRKGLLEPGAPHPGRITEAGRAAMAKAGDQS